MEDFGEILPSQPQLYNGYIDLPEYVNFVIKRFNYSAACNLDHYCIVKLILKIFNLSYSETFSTVREWKFNIFQCILKTSSKVCGQYCLGLLVTFLFVFQ